MAPPSITFRRTLTPAPCQNTRHGRATKVWDETEFRNLPGPAEGRHRCRWRRTRGQPASTTLRSRHAGRPKVATVRNPLDGLARHHRAKRALVGSHQLRRQPRYRGAARRGRSRSPGHPRSTTPGGLSFLQWADQDRSRRHQDGHKSPLRVIGAAEAIQVGSFGKGKSFCSSPFSAIRPPGGDREGPQYSGLQFTRPSWRSRRFASFDCPASRLSHRRPQSRCAAASAALAPRARGRP
jgi:hypothetical protein